MPAAAWRVELMRGLRLLAAGEFAKAEARFEAAHRRAPDQPEVCYALGRERLRRGQIEEAETLLRAAWGADRSLSVAAGALARCLAADAGRRDEAHGVLDQALALYPDEPGLLVVRAEILLDEERGDEARAALDRAHDALAGGARVSTATRSAIAAGRARVFNLEGVSLARAGRAEEALFAFKRASDQDPEWSAPVVNMGVAFAQLGRLARARSCYERTLVREPGNVVARFNLANLARERGDVTRAEAGYRAVLETDPAYSGARLALAELLLERRRAAEAIPLLQDELAVAPDSAHVWFQLGVAHEQEGQDGAAERHLRAALHIDPAHVPACCHLAAVLARAGEYLEAAALVRRARDIDPRRAESFLGPTEA